MRRKKRIKLLVIDVLVLFLRMDVSNVDEESFLHKRVKYSFLQ